MRLHVVKRIQRQHLVVAVFVFAFLLLQYRLWFQAGGIRDMMAMKQQLAQKADENQQIKVSNTALLNDVEHLKNSKESTESRSREELGMVKKGETLYRFVN